MNKLKTLEDLFLEEMNDIYHAETQLVQTLPKLSLKVVSEKLENVLDLHLEETKNHVARLEQTFELLGTAPAGARTQAIDGLLANEDEIRCADAEPPVKDAGIICATQKVEHFEIASYGFLLGYAERLGLAKIVRLLTANLQDEKRAEQALKEIAEEQMDSNVTYFPMSEAYSLSLA